MNIINNTLNNKTQIKVDDRIIDVNDIEKIERNPFSFKIFKLNIKLITGEVKYTNGNIYLRNLIITSSELIGIRRIEELRKGLKSMMYRGAKGMYDTKIELFLKGGNVITLEAENEKYGEYDFEQLKKIVESKKCIAE